MYVPATPELFHGGSTGTGGDGGGDGGAGGGPVATTTMTFAIAQSTDLTGLSTTTWSIVPLTAQPQIDTMNGYDPVTHKYTPKTAGYYAFNARGWPDVTNWGGIAILKNDDGVFDNLSADTVIALSVLSGPSGAIQATTGFSQMNGTTDYVRFFMAALPSGVATSVGSNPCFSALLLP
jgi:hypothetical protein